MNFKGEKWKNNIDVESFILDNYTEYTGDDSFLTGISEKTKKVWQKCEELLQEEQKKGVLDIETNIMSGIDNFEVGYIDKENASVIPLI